jgi:hypothetical protein
VHRVTRRHVRAPPALRGRWLRGDLLAGVVRLEAFGLAAKIGRDRLFPTLPTAVVAYQQWAAEQEHHPGQEPGESRQTA